MSALTTLTWKELKDISRDRRTIVVLTVVPILLYPLLLLAVGAMVVAGKQKLARAELTVALVGPEAQAVLGAQPPPPHTTWIRLDRSTAEERLQAEDPQARVGAVVVLTPGARDLLARDGQVLATVLYTQRWDRSLEAKARMVKLLGRKNVQVLQQRLATLGLNPSFAEPIRVDEEDVQFKKGLGPLIASRLLPVIFVLILLLGAFNAALDLTAGEKERGTLETLLVAPVRPAQVLAAKYLAVVVVAVVVALANVLMMAVTFRVGITFDEGMTARMSLSATQVAMLLVILGFNAGLLSAISLVVSSLAKTYREGQSYLAPVLVLAIMGGYAAMAPGVELNLWTGAVPILNLSVLVKAVILGAAHWGQVAWVSGWVAAYTLLSIWLAANAFASEALRFGGREGWRDLFRLRRAQS